MYNRHILKIPPIKAFETEYYYKTEQEMHSAKVFPPHLHDRLEIYVLINGDVSFMVENSLYSLEPGDAIISKPNEMHNCVLNTKSQHQHLCFWFDTTSDFLFADFLLHDFGQNNRICPDAENKKRLLQIYADLKIADEENNQRRRYYLIVEMLDIFARSLSVQTPQAMPAQLKTILDDISVNFAEIKTLDYFTKKYFLSQSTLNRLFRQYLHTSPKLYLETKRLAYSRRLLKEGKSVLAASISSGFSDYSNYIRLFKKRFGITPKAYKDS